MCQEDQEDHLAATELCNTASCLSTEHKCHTESLEGAAALTQTFRICDSSRWVQGSFAPRPVGWFSRLQVEILQL